ncbi:MAG: hypothetical protein E3K37_15995 [Candidatus Kuenenia sp.]|nr:hypothetical protein [Candidatus Kuenenia hertensis]
MQCPVCKTINLVMSERQGIEIDYCPQCRGVWLDRGELDKIIDRTSQISDIQENRSFGHSKQKPYPDYKDYNDKKYYDYKKKKKYGIFGDLFDFD